MALLGAALRELKPSGLPLGLGVLAGGALVAGLALGLAMALDPSFKGGPGAGFASGFGFFGLYPASFALALAGAFERRLLARAAWLAAATGAVVLAGLVFGGGTAIGDQGLARAVGTALCCAAFPGTGLGVLTLVVAGRGLSELRAGVAPGMVQAVSVELDRVGVVSFDDLPGLCHLGPGVEEATARAVAAAGRGAVELDAVDRLLWRRAWADERRQRLPGVVAAAGRLSLAELGAELRAPPPLIRRWIQDCAGEHRLAGAVDWKRGLLYSVSAAALNARQECPSCAGRLSLAGHGLLRCPHCDAQIFV